MKCSHPVNVLLHGPLNQASGLCACSALATPNVTSRHHISSHRLATSTIDAIPLRRVQVTSANPLMMSDDPTNDQASENTPLLSRDEEERNHVTSASASNSLRSHQKKPKRWPTIAALSVLSLAVLAILGLGFAAPAVVEEYAKEALVLEPTNVSIDSFTGEGVIARIQGKFTLDGTRVRRKSVRDLGRAGTWIAKEVESEESKLKVYLPEYGNLLLGTANIPPVKVNIRDRHWNHVDFLTELRPGNVKGVRRVAEDWLDGKLESLRVKGVATIPLKSGIFRLGTQTVEQSMRFGGSDIPTFPDFDIQKLRFDEYGQPGKVEGMKAMAVVSIMNEYPVKFDVPPLRFEVLVPDCDHGFLQLGDAQSEVAHILPRQYLNISVTGFIRQLPTDLTTACPGSNTSPLDSILADYLQGKKTTVYVRGGEQDKNTPPWIWKLIGGTIVPLPLPGHPFDNLIRKFSLANVHFNLPSPFADPDTPEAQPAVSATVKALVGLPREMNFNLDVDRVKADADVYYKKKKLGRLDLRKWQPARTSKTDDGLLIESDVNKAPLEITDDDVFADVVNALVFGGEGVVLGVKAYVDVNTVTALGEFVVRELPASGKVYVKPLSGSFESTVGDLEILDTTEEKLIFAMMINLTNPTEYSAKVPYVNISVSSNGTDLGFATAEKVSVSPGMNSVRVVSSLGGRDFISRYLSGENTTLTLRTHAETIPSIPRLGKALSGIHVEIPTPKVFGKFIKDATV